MAANACFQILKFSHATGVRPDHKVPWSHINAANMFVTIKGSVISVPDCQLVMRIFKGNEVLEDVDIGSYVDMATGTQSNRMKPGKLTQAEQLPIFAIAKDSLLAVRYRLQDGQARRLQIRFLNPSDCQSVVAHFERRGLQFQEYRPNTSSSEATKPHTTINRDESIIGDDHAGLHGANIAFGTRCSLTQSTAARQPSEQLPIVSPRGSGDLAPSSDLAVVADMHHLMHQSDDEVLLSVSAACFGSTPACTQAPNLISIQQMRCVEPGPTVGSNSSAPNMNTTLIPSRSKLDIQDRFSNESIRVPHPVYHVSPPSITQHNGSTQQVLELSAQGSSSRPSSAVSNSFVNSHPTLSTVTSNLPDTVEHEIPPRRELPFGRAGSQGTRSNASNSRPATSSSAFPSLPNLTAIRENSASLTKSQPNCLSPMKRPLEIDEGSDAKGWRTNSPRDQQQRTEVVPTISTASIAETPTLPIKKPSRMNDLLYGTTSVAGTPIGESLPSLGNATHVPPFSDSDPPNFTFDSRSSFRTELSGSKQSHPPIQSIPRHQEAVSVQDFSSQTREDRLAALEEFMLSHIDDPGFVQLCEDVENCWRRIALGL